MQFLPDRLADDPSLDGGYRLFRKVKPGWTKLDDLGVRPRSDVFQFQLAEKAKRFGIPQACMSLDSEMLTDAEGLSPSDLLVGKWEGYGIVALTAETLRSQELLLQRWPYPDPWHVLAFSIQRDKITQGQQKRLVRAAEWIIMPTPNALP